MELQEKIKSEGDEFEFEYKGLKCYMARHLRSGHWCGYVAIPKGSRLEKSLSYYSTDSELGLSEFEKAVNGIRVHGGITYTGKRKKDDPTTYWGFDCAHCFDLSPNYESVGHDEVYRDKEYVIKECKDLAEQIKEITETYF